MSCLLKLNVIQDVHLSILDFKQLFVCSNPLPLPRISLKRGKQRDKTEHCLFSRFSPFPSTVRWSGASALSLRGAERPAPHKQRPGIRTGLRLSLEPGFKLVLCSLRCPGKGKKKPKKKKQPTQLRAGRWGKTKQKRNAGVRTPPLGLYLAAPGLIGAQC